MSGKKNKQIRKAAKEMATMEKGYISKTTTKGVPDPFSDIRMQYVTKQTRLVDNCAKALAKMLKKARTTPRVWETAVLLKKHFYKSGI